MERTPVYAIRIEYRAGVIRAFPTAHRQRWAMVRAVAQQITRLPDLVAGYGPYNALYRVLDAHALPGYYLVEER